MVQDHARKDAARAVQAELGVTYTEAVQVLENDDQARAENVAELIADGHTEAEAAAIVDDPANETLCRTCGWTVGMVCPECPRGCGCETRCTGWRHREDRHEFDDPADYECTGCGALMNEGSYDECVCEPAPEPTPREEAERAAFNNWTSATTTNRAALAAVHRGLTIFPLPAGGRVPEPGWSERLVSTPEQVAASWPAGANVGVACGPSNIVVLDVDFNPVHNPGKRSSLAALAAELGETIPQTFWVDTPSGGQHLYFRAPEGVVVPSSSGGTTPLGRHVDVRAGGGYVIGPWSSVPGDEEELNVYTPGDTPGIPVDVAPLPAWILERIATPAAADRCPDCDDWTVIVPTMDTGAQTIAGRPVGVGEPADCPRCASTPDAPERRARRHAEHQQVEA